MKDNNDKSIEAEEQNAAKAKQVEAYAFQA